MSKKDPDFTLAEGRPVLSAILNRRDVRGFENRNIPEKAVRTILYAATWAPNHKLTEPWRFVVIPPEKKQEFTQKFIDGLMASATDPLKKIKAMAKAEKTKREFPGIPLFIAAACKTDPNPELSRENLIAAACGLQNMLLAAEEMGISAHWSTGGGTKTKIIQEYFGFAPDENFLGLFQMGYGVKKGRMKRSPLESFVRWK